MRKKKKAQEAQDINSPFWIILDKIHGVDNRLVGVETKIELHMKSHRKINTWIKGIVIAILSLTGTLIFK